MDGVIEFTGKINSELTFKVPLKYFRGNRYIMGMYDYDINSILTEAIKYCEAQSITNSYETLHNSLSTKGLKPRFQKLDNEASKILIQSLQDKNIDFQLVPPNIHWRNESEGETRTFKKYLIEGLCSVNTDLTL